MTDLSSPAPPHPPHPRTSTTAPTASSPPNGARSDTVMQDDAEDYTIKCICTYKDDDGSTVYCEKCETWQHIICYYHGKKVPDVHCCADCHPRQLDAKRAVEFQKRLRDHVDHADRKAKRPQPKNHKKKKDAPAIVDQANGVHAPGARDSLSAPRDQPPPAKRVKTNHRASASNVSMNSTGAGQPEPRKRASSNLYPYPSPAKSPSSQPLHPPIPMYSPEFLSLYQDPHHPHKAHDGDKFQDCSNSMSMAVTRDLTRWYDSPAALQRATGRAHDEVFHQSEQPLRPATWPRIRVTEKRDAALTYHGQCPTWKCVVLESGVQKNDFIGEIKGDIGRLEDYCLDPETRWNELRHPEPFVFFHPQVPIYIDSRVEGTHFRYVRRSCHPNVSLKTFVTGERDFHHCFVAKEDIPAGSELTTMWYIDQTLVANGKVKDDAGDDDEPWRRARYFSRILSNFGGCACETADCALRTFDLRTSWELPKKRADGRKARKPAKSAASASSTGHATNSRAGSENAPPSEEEEDAAGAAGGTGADSRSTSDSARSKPHSRDITPGHGQAADAADELSQREKKKIQMVERAFEEQQKQKAKRKRTSGGATVSTGPTTLPSTSGHSLPVTPSQASRPPDLNTAAGAGLVSLPPRSAPLQPKSHMSPHKSSAPNTPSPLSQSSHRLYVDRGMQTEPASEPDAAGSPDPTRLAALARFERYEQPHMRRLRRYQEWERQDRIKRDEMKRQQHAGRCSPFARIVPTWLEERRAAEKRRADRRSQDGEAAACATTASPRSETVTPSGRPDPASSGSSAEAVQLPPPPLPSQAAHTHTRQRGPPGPKLQLSTLPPVPPFVPPAAAGAPVPAAGSPTPTTPSVALSPLSNHTTTSSHPQSGNRSAGPVAPSPVKKKLSLGDYISRRSNLNTPVAEKPVRSGVEPAIDPWPPAAAIKLEDGHQSDRHDPSGVAHVSISLGGSSAVSRAPPTVEASATIPVAHASPATSVARGFDGVLSHLPALAGESSQGASRGASS